VNVFNAPDDVKLPSSAEPRVKYPPVPENDDAVTTPVINTSSIT